MADGELKTEISKDELANAVANPIWTQLSDGSAALSVTGGVLDVNATVVLDTSYVDDSVFVIGTDRVNAQGFLADETATDSVDEGDIGLARMTLDRRMITSSEQSGTWTVDLGATDNAVLDAIAASLVDIELNTDYGLTIGGGVEAPALRVTIASDSTGLLSVDDNGSSLTVDAVDLDIRALDHITIGDSVRIGDGVETMEVNPDGSINVVVSGSAGTPVADYNTTASVAKDATDNHDYTVVGTSFNLSRVSYGGSGRMKVEIQAGPVAGLITKAVRFSKRDTSDAETFDPAFPVLATGTGTVRVIRTQRSVGSLDVYSTIMGLDIA